jgi:GT2 family glycosyltransferase
VRPPTVDVVIVSFNTAADLEACLGSLAAVPPAGLGRIIVVDNASTDDSVARVLARWPDVRVVALERNVGFAAANNIAIRESGADLVLLLNSDTIVPAGAIDRLVARLLDTGAVAAGPRLVDADGHPEVSFGAMLSPWTEFRQRRLARLARSESPAARRQIARLLGSERMVDWVSGACLLVRRDAALAAGLLDERFFMYEEDVDFCAALRARGGRVLFTPVAEIVHRRGRSFRAAASANRHEMYDRSHLAFYAKHAPRWVPVLRLWMRLRGRGRQGRARAVR